MIRIENWCIVSGKQSPYQAPELATSHLCGRVFNHHLFADGSIVTTSSIIGIDSDDRIITKSGHSYELGAIETQYESQFPDAKKRLIDSLKLEQK